MFNSSKKQYDILIFVWGRGEKKPKWGKSRGNPSSAPKGTAGVGKLRAGGMAPQADTGLVAVALHPWTGGPTHDMKRYLAFEGGARIEVVEEREPGGWWAGKLDGKLGWFPSSFCRIEKAPAAVADLLGGSSASTPPSSMAREASSLAALTPTSATPTSRQPATGSATRSVRTPSKPPPTQQQQQQQRQQRQQQGAASVSLLGDERDLVRTPAVGSDAPASNSFFAEFERPLGPTTPTPAPATMGRSLGGDSAPPVAKLAFAATPDARTPSAPDERSGLLLGGATGRGMIGDMGVSGGAGLDASLQQCPMYAPRVPSPAESMSTASAGNRSMALPAGTGRPIWQSLSFIDLFADSAGGALAALNASSSSTPGGSAGGASGSGTTRAAFSSTTSGGGGGGGAFGATQDAAPTGLEALGSSMMLVRQLVDKLANETGLRELDAASHGFAQALEHLKFHPEPGP